MASAFSHALSAISIKAALPRVPDMHRIWLLGIICSILPDIDSIGFFLGVPYESVFGHRGITHSLPFALLLSFLILVVFFRNQQLRQRETVLLFIYFFLVTASHGVLDAITNGGLGIAFFAPFDNSRYFLPWRPVAVSPIGIDSFFSEWGQRVILSELIWIGIPCTTLLFLGWISRRLLPVSSQYD